MAQWLDPAAPMLARSLQQNGYATGHFGKWHMGGQRDVDDAPDITDYGFDVSLTNFEGMGPKLLPLTLKPGQDPAKPGRIWADAERLGEGYRWMQRSEITGGFVDEAIAFAQDAVANGKPFYINLWPDDVHSPFWPPVDEWANDQRSLYLSVLAAMDRQLGKLFQIARHSQTPTLILVCSDNGPEANVGSAGPFRGHKTFLYEGGIRSSLVAWGPGIIEAEPGTVDTTSVFSAIDLVPTLLDLTATPHPAGVTFDGESLVGTLTGSDPASRQAPIHFRRPPDRDSFYGVDDLPDLAVRSGKWKLLCDYDGSSPELYDLGADPGETTNLAAQHPELVASITADLISWNRSLAKNNDNSFRLSKSN